MRYFVMKQDERITDRPYPRDFFEKIDIRNATANRGGLLAARTLINIRPSEFTVFPDVLCSPVTLVTQESRNVIDKYDEYLVYRQIVYLDSENRKVQLYFMPMLEIIDCLSEKSEYVNESKTQLSKVVLRQAPIRDKSLFQIKNKTQRVIIIRLDLAESLLARDSKGFILKEADMEQ